jgi:hypothetical protein
MVKQSVFEDFKIKFDLVVKKEFSGKIDLLEKLSALDVVLNFVKEFLAENQPEDNDSLLINNYVESILKKYNYV